MAFDINAGFSFLSQRGISVKPTASPGYVSRLVGNIQRQEAAGLPLNRQAARGHVRTPEHPGRRRPIIPDNPSDYSRRPSRYTVNTRPLGAGGLRTPISIQRPAVHSRDITMTEDRIEAADNALIVQTARQEKAMTELRQHRAGTGTFDRAGRRRIIPPSAEKPGVSWRVRIDVYDCSKRVWVSIFKNRAGGHTHQGIGVNYLLDELSKSGMSLEEYLIRAAIDSGSGPHILLSHICLYQLHFIPGETDYWQSRIA